MPKTGSNFGVQVKWINSNAIDYPQAGLSPPISPAVGLSFFGCKSPEDNYFGEKKRKCPGDSGGADGCG